MANTSSSLHRDIIELWFLQIILLVSLAGGGSKTGLVDVHVCEEAHPLSDREKTGENGNCKLCSELYISVHFHLAKVVNGCSLRKGVVS